MEIEQTYKTIDVIIKSLKTARQRNDYLTLMANAFALLEYMPNLVLYSVTQEAQYRKFEAKLALESDENGKRNTSSFCDTQAKATQFYADWQKAKLFIELMYEMVQMAKKLAGSVDKEFNAS